MALITSSTSEYEDLAKQVVQGDGFGWPGDDRMWVGVGILKSKGKTGRRIEVWRDNEDGTSTIVAHWLPTEQFKVCYDLARMRRDSPSYVPVEDVIDEHNAKLEADKSARIQDAMGDMLEHGLRLQHDRNNPRNRFYGVKEAVTVGDRDLSSAYPRTPATTTTPAAT